jgi:RimJ/RimL family protein N-acetyltransferase
MTHLDTVTLETKRLIMRRFTLEDVDDVYEIFSDSVTMRHIEPPFSKEKTAEFLREFCIERDPPGAYAAALSDGGKVIGYMLFKEIDEPEIYEIGWIFNRAYWRQGYAYEAACALIRYGFDKLCLHKICAETDDGEKSLQLALKLGMTIEGKLREHSKQQDGSWSDKYLLGICSRKPFSYQSTLIGQILR